MEPHISRTVGFSVKTCKRLCTSALQGIQSFQSCIHFGQKHEVTFRHGFTQGTVIVHLFEVSEMQFLHWT